MIKLIAGHVAGSAAASTVFLTGLSLAPGDIPAHLAALGVVGPLAVAALSVALHHHARTLDAAGRYEVAQWNQQIDEARRTQVAAPARQEVTAR